MLSKRIIACLDVRNGQVVKGVNFEGLRSAGDPAELARRYNAEGIDELVILDVTATLEARRALADTISRVARELFIPLAVGGGIRTEADAAAAVEAGADCAMTAAVSSAVSIPVIASGGAGGFDHFVDVFTTGRADAALAASIFHYAETSVWALKLHLQQRGIPVRL